MSGMNRGVGRRPGWAFCNGMFPCSTLLIELPAVVLLDTEFLIIRITWMDSSNDSDKTLRATAMRETQGVPV